MHNEFELSRYNHQIMGETAYLVYNSYSGLVLSCETPLSLNEYSDKEIEKLFAWGFITLKGQNENDRFISLRNDLLNDNTLCLTFIPSYKCSFSCKYCYQKKDNTKIGVQQINGIVMYLKKNISRYRNIHYSMFGGEPLESFEECLQVGKAAKRICENNNKPFTSEITTNGFFLTKDVVQELISIRCQSIQITLDGPKKTHDYLRPRAGCDSTFDVIFKNIKENAQELDKRHVKLVIRINISSFQVDGFEEFLKRISSELGKNYKNIAIYFYPVSNWNKQIHFSTDEKSAVFDLIKKWGKTPYFPRYLIDKISPGGNICFGYYKNSFAIDPYGALTNCTVNTERWKYAIIEESGVLRQTAYVPEIMEVQSQCIGCALLGTCFGLRCRNYHTCDKELHIKLLDQYMLLMEKQGETIAWRVNS